MKIPEQFMTTRRFFTRKSAEKRIAAPRRNSRSLHVTKYEKKRIKRRQRSFHSLLPLLFHLADDKTVLAYYYFSGIIVIITPVAGKETKWIETAVVVDRFIVSRTRQTLLFPDRPIHIYIYSYHVVFSDV